MDGGFRPFNSSASPQPSRSPQPHHDHHNSNSVLMMASHSPVASSRSIHRDFGSTRSIHTNFNNNNGNSANNRMVGGAAASAVPASNVSKTEEEEAIEMLVQHTTNRYSLLGKARELHEKVYMRTTWSLEDFKCWLSLQSDFHDVLQRAISGTEVRTKEAASLKRSNTVLSPFVLAVARRRQKERQDKANFRRAQLVELAHARRHKDLILLHEAYEQQLADAMVAGANHNNSASRQASSEGRDADDGDADAANNLLLNPPPPIPPPPPFREVALPNNRLEDWIERLNCCTDWVVAVPADYTIPEKKTRANIDNFLKWHLMVPITSTAKSGSWAHKALMTAERLKASQNVRSVADNIELGGLDAFDAEEAVTSVRMSVAAERRYGGVNQRVLEAIGIAGDATSSSTAAGGGAKAVSRPSTLVIGGGDGNNTNNNNNNHALDTTPTKRSATADASNPLLGNTPHFLGGLRSDLDDNGRGGGSALAQPSRESIAFWVNQHEQAGRMRQESLASINGYGGGGGGSGAVGNGFASFYGHNQQQHGVRSSLHMSNLSTAEGSPTLGPSATSRRSGGFKTSNTKNNTTTTRSSNAKVSKETLEMQKMLKFVDRQRNRYVSAMSPVRCGIDVFVRGEDGLMHGPGSRIGAGLSTSVVGNTNNTNNGSFAGRGGGPSSPLLPASLRGGGGSFNHNNNAAAAAAMDGGCGGAAMSNASADASSYPYEGELRLFGEGWGRRIEYNRIPILKIEQVRLSNFLSPTTLRRFTDSRAAAAANGGGGYSRRGVAGDNEHDDGGFGDEDDIPPMADGEEDDNDDGSPTITVLLLAKSFFTARPVRLGATSYFGLRFDTNAKALRYISEVDSTSRLLQYLTDEVVKIITTWVSYDLTPPMASVAQKKREQQQQQQQQQQLLLEGGGHGDHGAGDDEEEEEGADDPSRVLNQFISHHQQQEDVEEGADHPEEGSGAQHRHNDTVANADDRGTAAGQQQEKASPAPTSGDSNVAAAADPIYHEYGLGGVGGGHESGLSPKVSMLTVAASSGGDNNTQTNGSNATDTNMNATNNSNAMVVEGSMASLGGSRKAGGSGTTPNTAASTAHNSMVAGTSATNSMTLAPPAVVVGLCSSKAASSLDGSVSHQGNTDANANQQQYVTPRGGGAVHPQNSNNSSSRHRAISVMSGYNNTANSTTHHHNTRHHQLHHGTAAHHHHDNPLTHHLLQHLGAHSPVNNLSLAPNLAPSKKKTISVLLEQDMLYASPTNQQNNNGGYYDDDDNDGSSTVGGGYRSVNSARNAGGGGGHQSNNNSFVGRSRSASGMNNRSFGGGKATSAVALLLERTPRGAMRSGSNTNNYSNSNYNGTAGAFDYNNSNNNSSPSHYNNGNNGARQSSPSSENMSPSYFASPNGSVNNRGGDNDEGGRPMSRLARFRNFLMCGTSSSSGRLRSPTMSEPFLPVSERRNGGDDEDSGDDRQSSRSISTARHSAYRYGQQQQQNAGRSGGNIITTIAKSVITANMDALTKGGANSGQAADFSNFEDGVAAAAGGAGGPAGIDTMAPYATGVHPLYRDLSPASYDGGRSVGVGGGGQPPASMAQQMAADAMQQLSSSSSGAAAHPQPRAQTQKSYEQQRRLAMKQMESVVRIIRSCTLHAQDRLQVYAISERRQHFALSIAVESYLHSQLYVCVFPMIKQMSALEDDRLDSVRDHFYSILVEQREAKAKRRMRQLALLRKGERSSNAAGAAAAAATEEDSRATSLAPGDNDDFASGVSSPAGSPNHRGGGVPAAAAEERDGGVTVADDGEDEDAHKTKKEGGGEDASPTIDAVFFGAAPSLADFNPFVYRSLVAGINDTATTPLDKLQRIRALFLQVAAQAELINAYDAYRARQAAKAKARAENNIPPYSHHREGGGDEDYHHQHSRTESFLSSTQTSSMNGNAGLERSFVNGFGGDAEGLEKGEGICADDVVALLSLVLLACPCANLYSQVQYLVTFSSEATEEDSELEYAFVSFRVAVENLLQEERRLSGEASSCGRNSRRDSSCSTSSSSSGSSY